MSAQWLDRLAVMLAVAFAVSWLAFHYRHKWRKNKESTGGIGACGAPCEDCPYSKDCGGKAP